MPGAPNWEFSCLTSAVVVAAAAWACTRTAARRALLGRTTRAAAGLPGRGVFAVLFA